MPCGWHAEAFGPLGWRRRRRMLEAMGWPGWWPFEGPGFSFPFAFRRRFITRQEQLEQLQRYLEELRREARAVEEAIERLRREQPGDAGAAP